MDAQTIVPLIFQTTTKLNLNVSLPYLFLTYFEVLFQFETALQSLASPRKITGFFRNEFS